MVRGSPCMCIATKPAPASATTASIRGSARPADTSLTTDAPAAIAAAATAAFVVSMLTGTPELVASAATTGNTRARSSASVTGSAPGRVDSPPTSSTSAPSAANASPWRIAASGSR